MSSRPLTRGSTEWGLVPLLTVRRHVTSPGLLVMSGRRSTCGWSIVLLASLIVLLILLGRGWCVSISRSASSLIESQSSARSETRRADQTGLAHTAVVEEHCSTVEGEVARRTDFVGVDGIHHHLLLHLDDDQLRGKNSKTFCALSRAVVLCAVSDDN